MPSPDGDQRPSDWQRALLRTMLRLSAAVLCLIPVVDSTISGTLRTYLWLLEFAGLFCILLTRVAPLAHRTVALTYLIVVFVLTMLVGASNAWCPPVVASLCYLSVSAGLLFGPRAVLLVALATSAMLELGGWLVHTGRFSIPLSATTDPRIPRNWVLSSGVFLLIVAMAAWVLRSALDIARDVAEEANAAIRTARERLNAATELRAARLTQEMSLRHSQRLQMVAQLGEGFAHLFNNLLTVVRCGCEDLRAIGTPKAAHQVAHELRRVVGECAERTRELLAISRAKQETFTAVSVGDAVRDGFAQVTARLRTNVRCELSAARCGAVHMPSSWMEQILTNLLLNAEQALTEGGHIAVEASMVVLQQPRMSAVDPLPPGRYAMISVSDDGEGISVEAAQRACEPFYTTKSQARHAGLGLTLVHGMAKQLGGSLEFFRLEQGTQVSVFLPCSEPDEPIDATVAGTAARLAYAEAGRPDSLGRPADAAGGSEPSCRDARTTAGAPSGEPNAGVLERSRPRTRARGGSAIAARTRADRCTNTVSAAGARAPQTTGCVQSADSAACSTDVEASAQSSPQPAAAADSSGSISPGAHLNRLIWVMAGIVLIQALNSFYLGYPRVGAVYDATAVLLVAMTLAPKLPYALRLWTLLLSLLAITLLAIANTSFLSPSPMLGMALPAFFAAVYGTRRTMVGAFAGIASCMACAGWLWTRTQHHGDFSQVVGSAAANWFRIGIAWPIVLFGVAVTVLRVVSTAQSHATALVAARRELDRSHVAYQAETEALLRIEDTRSRAARMEAGGLLTGMAAHDLNNSLTAIVGWSELLEDAADPAEFADAVTAISRAADYAEALVQQLQHKTGLDHRGPSLDIGAALARMQAMLVAASTMKQHNLSVDLRADAGCYVAISEHSLRRVVLNLVTNARDASSERGGRCAIRATRDESTVNLEASDDGCGMDEPTRRRVFEAFFSTKGAQGTGLGLHSVMEIVTATHGTVEVWSESGVGTRVTIRWPLAPPAVSLAPSAVHAQADVGHLRILLAEDHPTVRSVMARGLRRAGHVVIEAHDGDEALRQLENGTQFDLLCTDAVMPGLPVTEVVRRFAERHSGCAILVVTGYMPEELEPQLRANAQVRILFKPVTQEQLVQAIQSHAKLADGLTT